MNSTSKTDLPIIDAHHHYWDPVNNDHPWLNQKPMITFRYGDYSAICQPFMPTDYDRHTAGWNIIATVTMEGEWNPSDPLAEAHWLQHMHNTNGRPAAHVAQAWLDRDDLPAVLDTLQQLPIVKSVRHKPRSNPSPGGSAGGMTDSAFIKGFKQLRAHGLHFDLQTPWWHLADAARLAAHSPDTQIILNHTGLPSDRSTDGLAAWHDAMRNFAALDQASVKISGLGLADRAWTIEDNRDIVRRTIDLFGVKRCLFASNFPVDGLCGTFDTIYGGYLDATSDFSLADQDALFAGNAARIYTLKI